eukprot:1181507-Prorocentrum_minimum.AAC.4
MAGKGSAELGRTPASLQDLLSEESEETEDNPDDDAPPRGTRHQGILTGLVVIRVVLNLYRHRVPIPRRSCNDARVLPDGI